MINIDNMDQVGRDVIKLLTQTHKLNNEECVYILNDVINLFNRVEVGKKTATKKKVKK